jgi:hypothetical protein
VAEEQSEKMTTKKKMTIRTEDPVRDFDGEVSCETRESETITQVLSRVLEEMNMAETAVAELRGNLFGEAECKAQGGQDKASCSIESMVAQSVNRLHSLNMALRVIISRV